MLTETCIFRYPQLACRLCRIHPLRTADYLGFYPVDYTDYVVAYNPFIHLDILVAVDSPADCM